MDAFAAFLPVSGKAALGRKGELSFDPVSLGSPVTLNLRGVVGFTDVLIKIIVTVADKGVVILGWVFNGGNQYFFTRERLKTMDDLRGKRIRYPGGDAWRLSIEAFGAQGIALPYTEVVTSLQTNLIDGLITNFAGGVSAYSLRDYTPYATMVLLSTQPIAIVANADWWNGLTAEKRKSIELTFAVMDASAYFDNMRAGLVKDWAAVEGYEANYPADADAWIAKMQEAARPLLSDVDPALLEAIEAAR